MYTLMNQVGRDGEEEVGREDADGMLGRDVIGFIGDGKVVPVASKLAIGLTSLHKAFLVRQLCRCTIR